MWSLFILSSQCEVGKMATVQNTTCTGCLKCAVNFDTIGNLFPSVAFSKGMKHAAKIRLDNVTVRIFRSGKMVSTGAKDADIAKNVMKKIASKFESDVLDFKLCNIVANAKLPFHLDLNAVRAACYRNSFYEPEIFCGLKLRLEIDVTVLVFHTGSIVLTGAKTFEQIDDAYICAYEILRPHAKKT